MIITPNWDEKNYIANAFNGCTSVASINSKEHALYERTRLYGLDEATVMMQVMRNLIASSAQIARENLN